MIEIVPSQSKATPEELELLNRIHSLFLNERGLAEDFQEFLAEESVVSYLKECILKKQ